MTRALSPIAAAALLAAALGCSKSEPTLILEVAPADAVVSVDGYAHPGSSPHAIDFKAPGRYLLTVSREGYRDVEMYVTLEPGERRRKSVELVALGAPIAVDPSIWR